MPDLPKTTREWSNLVAELELENQSIHTYCYADSGSKISLKQFFLLRVLRAKKRAEQVLGASEFRGWELDRHLETSREFLKEVPGWDQYISSYHRSLAELQSGRFSSLGIFSLVRLYQLNVGAVDASSEGATNKVAFTPIAMRTRARTGGAEPRPTTPVTPTPSSRSWKTPETGNDYGISGDEDMSILEKDLSALSLSGNTPRKIDISPQSPLTEDFARILKDASDEQIVNMALLVFLDAIVIHCPLVKTDWTPERRGFTVKDRRQSKVYEARVDGFLRHRIRDDEILAIIEVKPYAREGRADAVRMQEGAQVAAWISQHPPPATELTKDGRHPSLPFRCVLSTHRLSLTSGQSDGRSRLLPCMISHKNSLLTTDAYTAACSSLRTVTRFS